MKHEDIAWLLMEAYRDGQFDAAWRIVPLLEDPNPEGGRFAPGGGREPAGTQAAKKQPKKAGETKKSGAGAGGKKGGKPPSKGGASPGGTGGGGSGIGGGAGTGTPEHHEPWHDPLPSDEALSQATRRPLTRTSTGEPKVEELTLNKRRYILKHLRTTPERRPRREIAVSRIHRELGLHTAPEMELRPGGNVLTHRLPGVTLDVPPHQKRQMVQALSDESVVHTLTANWFTLSGDRQPANYLVDGQRIFTIDHEYAFHPSSRNSIEVMRRVDALVENLSESQRSLPLDKRMLQRILDRREEIDRVLTLYVFPVYSEPARKELQRSVTARYKKVAQLLRAKNPTVADLLEG